MTATVTLPTTVAKLKELVSSDLPAAMRQQVEQMLSTLMESEVAEQIGAELHQQAPDRAAHRNGYRLRKLETQLGQLDVRIPRLREGSYFPSFLEPRCRLHASLAQVVMEAYTQGISTRKITELAEALGMSGISKSAVSGMLEDLSAGVQEFASRPLPECPYVFLDARYEHVREHGRVVSKAVLVAVGVTTQGRRELLGYDVAAIDHLPAYRQEQRALRVGDHIPRAKLCRWHIALTGFLAGVADALFDEIVASDVIGIDDSVHRLLVNDRHCCQQARIWAVTAPAGTFYLFSPTREGRWISELFEDYHGAVMGDAYAGHKALLSRDDIIALFCWAHVRRKFYDSADTVRRGIMLAMIGELYAIEDEITAAPPAQKVFVRSAQAKPVLDRIRAQLDAWRIDPHVLPGSGIGKAVSYALKLWQGLVRYLTIGTAPIDNNRTERSMRSAAMQRKNSLFSASVAGAEAYAILLTLARSAVDLGLDPVAYLSDIIEDIHFARRPVRDLTPQAYARRNPSKHAGRS